MNILEIVLIAVGLAMDAFAVSICKGLSLRKPKLNEILQIGLWFGIFQALMPTIGYFTGTKFSDYVSAFDHWIVFFLLGIIGANMIKEALLGEDDTSNSLNFKEMLFLAIATSIDAFAVGISFALMKVNVFASCIMIGVTTFMISAAGVKIGSIFGTKFKAKAEIAGGIILIIIGIKILFQHLNLNIF